MEVDPDDIQDEEDEAGFDDALESGFVDREPAVAWLKIAANELSFAVAGADTESRIHSRKRLRLP
jgi:hypothetical protein